MLLYFDVEDVDVFVDPDESVKLLSIAMRGIADTRPRQAMMNERRAPSSARALQSKRRFLRIKDHHFGSQGFLEPLFSARFGI